MLTKRVYAGDMTTDNVKCARVAMDKGGLDWERMVFGNRGPMYYITQHLALADIVRLTSTCKRLMFATVEPDCTWKTGEAKKYHHDLESKLTRKECTDKKCERVHEEQSIKYEAYCGTPIRVRVLQDWMRPGQKMCGTEAVTEEVPKRMPCIKIWKKELLEFDETSANLAKHSDYQVLQAMWSLKIGPVIAKARCVSEIEWRYRPLAKTLDHHAYVSQLFDEGVSDWKASKMDTRMERRLTASTVFNMRATCTLRRQGEETVDEPQAHVMNGSKLFTTNSEDFSLKCNWHEQEASWFNDNNRRDWLPTLDARGKCHCGECNKPREYHRHERWQRWHWMHECEFHDEDQGNGEFITTAHDAVLAWVQAEARHNNKWMEWITAENERGSVAIVRARVLPMSIN